MCDTPVCLRHWGGLFLAHRTKHETSAAGEGRVSDGKIHKMFHLIGGQSRGGNSDITLLGNPAQMVKFSL